MKKFIGSIFLLFLSALAYPQKQLSNGTWRAQLDRKDGKSIPFTFEVKDSAGVKVLVVRNAAERLLVDNVLLRNDSVYIQMPFFDSRIQAKILEDHSLKGEWIKRLEAEEQSMPFTASYSPERFPINAAPSVKNISGRWSVTFVSLNGKDTTLSVGEFNRKGNVVTGTFLNPTGDYRYLEGVIDGDTLKLSCFDGGHAYLFTAMINSDQSLTNGAFYSGRTYIEKWSAKKNAKAALADEYAITKMKDGESKLNFRFKSIDGDTVSINDARFRNKVVLLQIMGSWCPNCMDETAFLSDYYNRHQNAGIEAIALAYERSTDYGRSQKSIRQFQQRFNVKYPMLVTGVTGADTLRTEKTLPQLEKIDAFPTLIFIDKRGNVRKIHSGFTGPGTGVHYEHFKDEFDKIVGALLREK